MTHITHCLPPRLPTYKTSGFSLVELSIVLVILGLLVGGVLSGRALIRAAELRNITTEFSEWQTALNTFKTRYNALPGDMPNATSFWGNAATGASSGQYAAPLTDAGTGKQTCNGDGNMKIQYTWKGALRTDLHEAFRFWQHLQNAGLIAGGYTGTAPAGTAAYTGSNSPQSRAGSDAYWGIIRLGGGLTPFWQETAFGLTSNMDWSMDYNSIGLGKISQTDGLYGAPVGGFLTPSEAWGIDTKIDDGKPGTGKVMATIPNYSGARCALGTRSDWATTGYDLSSSRADCALLFPQMF